MTNMTSAASVSFTVHFCMLCSAVLCSSISASVVKELHFINKWNTMLNILVNGCFLFFFSFGTKIKFVNIKYAKLIDEHTDDHKSLNKRIKFNVKLQCKPS